MKNVFISLSLTVGLLGVLCSGSWAQSSPKDIHRKVERETRRSVAQRYVKEQKNFLQQYRRTFGLRGNLKLYTSSLGPSLRGHTDKILYLHVPEKAALTCWRVSRQTRLKEVAPFTPKAGEVLNNSTKEAASWQTLISKGRMRLRVRVKGLPSVLAEVSAPEDLMDAYIAGKRKPSQLDQFMKLHFCPQVKDEMLRAQLDRLAPEDKPYVSVDALY